MQCTPNQYKQNHAHNLIVYSSFSSRLLNSVIEGEQTVTDFRLFQSSIVKGKKLNLYGLIPVEGIVSLYSCPLC